MPHKEHYLRTIAPGSWLCLIKSQRSLHSNQGDWMSSPFFCRSDRRRLRPGNESSKPCASRLVKSAQVPAMTQVEDFCLCFDPKKDFISRWLLIRKVCEDCVWQDTRELCEQMRALRAVSLKPVFDSVERCLSATKERLDANLAQQLLHFLESAADVLDMMDVGQNMIRRQKAYLSLLVDIATERDIEIAGHLGEMFDDADTEHAFCAWLNLQRGAMSSLKDNVQRRTNLKIVI
ncbi:hypothetical protein EJ05DRAFT_280539 [Pseudovirgaria hyperparasitica]|uniref:Uncharacterized protein n=1 Tax=Pseudovirgaria hyperparasitica TaxID=470096 RepID=A0A6A6WFI2_9PEZI|nr:uncharacterized protein EJ05DRAFT_280539 [Pseudovirgaria hyperparasitica]KAF2760347.1 hypothetical protein EJ05DRAFT_280539 [Pseudovirgaria hyperparasitica]